MKKYALLVLILCLSNVALAGDEWFCSSESSRRSGSLIQACGVGEAATEAEARVKATQAAREEFNLICRQDSQCVGRALTVNPKRQTCSIQGGQIKCVRMVEYTIGRDLDSNKPQAPVASGARPLEVTDAPKIHKGMTKAELLAAFGTPDQYIQASDQYLILNYVNSSFCNGRCTIGLDGDRVYKFDGFKIQNTDVLVSKSFWGF